MNVLVFCDIQSNFLAARREFGPFARLDFVKLKSLFYKNLDDQVDAFAYAVVSPLHDDRKFTTFLKTRGFKVLRQFANISKEASGVEKKIYSKNWISRMIREFHPLIAIDKYDHYIIVSGSARFISCVNAIHNLNKKVTVMSFKTSLHPALAEKADEIVYLDKDLIYDEKTIKANKPELISNETDAQISNYIHQEYEVVSTPLPLKKKLFGIFQE